MKKGGNIVLIIIFGILFFPSLSSFFNDKAANDAANLSIRFIMVFVFGVGLAFNVISLIRKIINAPKYKRPQPPTQYTSNYAMPSPKSAPITANTYTAPAVTHSAKALNILFNGRIPDRYTNAQIDAAAKMYEEQRLRIFNDCKQILNTTCDPKTFFSRYDLLIDTLNVCVELEKEGSYFHKVVPSVYLNSILSQKETDVDNFIDRSYEDTVNKASSLKTQTARDNRLKKYFDLLKNYETQMSPKNIRHIMELHENNQHYTILTGASAKEEAPVTYINNGNVIKRADGKPISDEEVPYLIERGLIDALDSAHDSPFEE